MCDQCAADVLNGHNPVRDAQGQEYCSVSYGRRMGECERCAVLEGGAA